MSPFLSAARVNQTGNAGEYRQKYHPPIVPKARNSKKNTLHHFSLPRRKNKVRHPSEAAPAPPKNISKGVFEFPGRPKSDFRRGIFNCRLPIYLGVNDGASRYFPHTPAAYFGFAP